MAGLLSMDEKLLTTNIESHVVELCLSDAVNDAEAYESLMGVIRVLGEMQSISDSENAAATFEAAKNISSRLKKHSRRHKAMRYYYYGMYHAMSDQIFKDYIQRQSIIKQQNVINRKYFSQIMNILYAKDIVRQSELARKLCMDRSNLSREMNLLIQAGFVEERKTSKLKLYNLSAVGCAYCNKFFAMKHSMDPSDDAELRKLKMNTIRDELEYSEETDIESERQYMQVFSPVSRKKR